MAALTEKEKRELDATRRENGIKTCITHDIFSFVMWLLSSFRKSVLDFDVSISQPNQSSYHSSSYGDFGAICMWEQSRMYSREQNLRLKRNFISKRLLH